MIRALPVCPFWPPGFLPEAPRLGAQRVFQKPSVDGGLCEVEESLSYEASLFLKYWISLSKRMITIRSIQSMAEKHSKEVSVSCFLGDAMQGLPEVWGKGIEIDVLDRHANGIVSLVSSPSFCLADELPVGSLVRGDLKAFPLDKGFEQINGMSVFVYPIVPDAASNESRNVACQMGNAYPGKNKKTRFIGDEGEILFPLQSVPADE